MQAKLPRWRLWLNPLLCERLLLTMYNGEFQGIYSKNFWQWEFRSVCFIEMQLIRGWICDLFIPSSMYVSCLQINSTSVIMHLVVLLGLVFQLRLGCSAKYFTVPVALCSLFIWALHSMLLFLCWDLEEVVGKYQANTVLSGRQVWHS